MRGNMVLLRLGGRSSCVELLVPPVDEGAGAARRRGRMKIGMGLWLVLHYSLCQEKGLPAVDRMVGVEKKTETRKDTMLLPLGFEIADCCFYC